MKVALVHDYLNEFGGAERVLLALSEIYPDAPIYTIYKKHNSPAGKEFKNHKIIESWFGEIPFCDKLISPLRFLVPLIWSSFDFSEYDLVITSAAWAVTKGMNGAKKEICYIHTPPRYLYGYDSSRNWKNKWFANLVHAHALFVNHFMRMYDFDQAQKPDYYVVNSKNVGKRVEKFYRRKDYTVVYPPVDLRPYRKNSLLRGPASRSAIRSFSSDTDYYLTGGRLAAHKNFDKIVKACSELGVKLKIFGVGAMENELKELSNENVEFLGRVSEEKLISLYKGAKAFIVASKDEDFGITPIEAAAAGCPTIAYKAEGYLESVVDGKTGLFFEKLTSKSIANVIKKSEKKKWNKQQIRSHAKKFSEERFKKEIKKIVDKKMGGGINTGEN